MRHVYVQSGCIAQYMVHVYAVFFYSRAAGVALGELLFGSDAEDLSSTGTQESRITSEVSVGLSCTARLSLQERLPESPGCPMAGLCQACWKTHAGRSPAVPLPKGDSTKLGTTHLNLNLNVLLVSTRATSGLCEGWGDVLRNVVCALLALLAPSVPPRMIPNSHP